MSRSGNGMLVETDALSKVYGDIAALRDCTLRIEEGQIFGLLGPNGAGKTTLLRILMGFLRATAGMARIHGHDCWRESPLVHRHVAYLPGDVRLFRNMSVASFLRFTAELRDDRPLVQRGYDLCQRLDLPIDQRIALMSTGMKQKLALASTLAAQTPLTILDEPTTSLDPNVRQQVNALLREIRGQGRTVILSSHILPEVEETCDRVAVLKQGRIATMEQIDRTRWQHRVRGTYLGPRPVVPAQLADQLIEESTENGQVSYFVPGSLQPILGWLGTITWQDIRIEPVSLREIYDRYHADETFSS